MKGKASAIAHSNIALVKYWGKRDEDLMLPHNSSISLTLDAMWTHTTVELLDAGPDCFCLNEEIYTSGDARFDPHLSLFLKHARHRLGFSKTLRVHSKNNFPTAAGLASSASGFAALALALARALDLDLSPSDLSILARLGSGSASRSIFGGFAEWQRGAMANGEDSLARELLRPEDWPDVRLLVCVTSREKKSIKSRAGMTQSVATSPMYQGWLKAVERDLVDMHKAISQRNFEQMGQVAERNCLAMHATMLTTEPAIIYWNAATMEIMRQVTILREQGYACYFTIDAGPQVKVLCQAAQVSEIRDRLSALSLVAEIIEARPGPSARIVTEDLF